AKFLQNIVQRECEERFELTEALSEARRELLELKKPPGGYQSNGSKRGSIVSLGSAQSTTSSHGGARGGGFRSQSHTTPGQASHTPAPPSLSKRIEQQASNILLSYSNNNNNNNNSNNNSGSGKSGSSGDKNSEAQLR
ncbi:hypothetical protein EGW08_011456, partial [Elysia chlorotica]